MVTINESVLPIDRICRLCLLQTKDLSHMFSEEDNMKNIVSKIVACVSLQVSACDPLPKQICSSCVDQIENWHKFKELCLESDCVLRQQMKTLSSTSMQETRCSSENEVECDSNDTCLKTEMSEDIMDINVPQAPDFTEDEKIEEEKSEVSMKKASKTYTQDPSDTGEDVTAKRDSNTKYNVYGCTKCGKTFYYTSKFSFHMCMLSHDKRFACNVCGNDYSTVGAVKTHLHIHKGKHKCPTCGKSFPSQFQVNVHTRIHTGEKPYVCEFCGKRFAYDKGLMLHMSVHTGIKPYKCDLCEYSTTSRSYIKTHRSVHSTEKPFVCEICGQGYTLLPSLLNHQLNHSDQKTYVCEVCNKGFNTARKLASHMVMHSGLRPYHCDDCGKKFARKEGLKEHKVIHTGEKKFACVKCGKHFAWRKILRTHKCSAV